MLTILSVFIQDRRDGIFGFLLTFGGEPTHQAGSRGFDSPLSAFFVSIGHKGQVPNRDVVQSAQKHPGTHGIHGA